MTDRAFSWSLPRPAAVSDGEGPAGREREGRWSAAPASPRGSPPCRRNPSAAPEPYRVRNEALGLQHPRPPLRPGPLRGTEQPRLSPRRLGRPGLRLPATPMRRHPRLGPRGRERGAAAALCEPAPSRTPRLLMSPGSWIATGAPRTQRTARRAASAGCTRRGPGAPAPTPPSPPPHRPPPTPPAPGHAGQKRFPERP
ncbi:hypothetical protein NN561_001531 [Cricetulus griseus]